MIFISNFFRFLDVFEQVCSAIRITEQKQKLGKIENIILTVKEKIGPIYKLHQNLRERLISAADVYLNGTYSRGKKTINIGDIFIDMRHQFLVYAPVADLILNAGKAIDIAKLDVAGKRDFDRIENMMRLYANESESKTVPTNLNSLFIRPVQHIMR